ncbi:hypothetical protein [Nonomuraea jabiensis]|uniref:hypothetical protein n=1 Tax=Nonomuraea jabiensis TaxID=882448 RepID=UPI0036A20D57
MVTPRPRAMAWCRARQAFTSAGAPRSTRSRERRQRGRIGQDERPLDALQGGDAYVLDQLRPAREAVLAGQLELRPAQRDAPGTLAVFGLLAQMLQRRALGKIGHGEPPAARVRALGPRSVDRMACAAGGTIPSRGLDAPGNALPSWRGTAPTHGPRAVRA